MRVTLSQFWDVAAGFSSEAAYPSYATFFHGFLNDSIATRPIRTECEDCSLAPAKPAFLKSLPQVPSTWD